VAEAQARQFAGVMDDRIGCSKLPSGKRVGREGGGMLVKCTECQREISDRATSCPHCGAPVGAGPSEIASIKLPRERRTPIFLIIGAVALGLSLVTPRLLLFFPLMLVFGCGLISIFRRESGRAGAVAILLLGVGIIALNESGSPSATASTDAAEIKSWNWRPDPNFGTRGTIKWNVEVRNKSTRNLKSVKVQFTTYDAAGALVASTFTYVQAIPPGETRSDSSFADYYRTERNAVVKIAEVYFSN
jgi:hypothetical protein